jgi:dolichyl-phosphate-mannose-protein mannosyltransferase
VNQQSIRHPPSAIRSAACRIAVYALGLRLTSALLAFFVTLAFPLAQPPTVTPGVEPSPFWDPFTRYDAGWYYQIARSGYAFVPGGPSVGVGKPGKIAYFPLYPLLMRYTGRLFGRTAGDVYLGGIAVSWIAFVAAMIALYYLARLDLPHRRAERAALLTAVFPFSFFFGMVYTEALFLLLVLLSVLGFRRRRWLLGGVAGALATATRVNGILIWPALAWIAWRGASDARDRVRAAIGLLLVGAGVGAYSLYVYRLSGHPFEWAVSISRWGYYPGGAPWRAPLGLVKALAMHPYAYLAGDRMALYDTLYGVTGLAFVAAIPFVWWRFGAAYGLFMALNLWLPLSSGTFEGLGRYCSVLFPCFIWLATIRSRAVGSALVVGFALFYMLALALFVTNHPLF